MCDWVLNIPLNLHSYTYIATTANSTRLQQYLVLLYTHRQISKQHSSSALFQGCVLEIIPKFEEYTNSRTNVIVPSGNATYTERIVFKNPKRHIHSI